MDKNGNLKRFRLGPVAQKILLILKGEAALLLAGGYPHKQIRVLKKISREWQKINRKSLRLAIRRLYQSKLIDYKENGDGTVSVVLTDDGKKKILQYDLDKIEIQKPLRWDKLWRLVIFDIPETQKKGRNALTAKLKQLGFFPMQKSVFIYPYECKNEIDFIVEIFNLRPYVRFLVVKETDIDLDLKSFFKLL